MPWYRTGTISVTNGSTTVTGSGTSWVTNALTGEGLQAPDGRVYEIASITSATQLTLTSAYLGSNQTGQTYAILPTHTFAKDLASEVSALVVDYQTSKSDFDAGSFSKGTTAAPGINFGVNGQSNTGFTNETTGEIGISIAGTNRGKITATGLNATAIGATTAAPGTFTNLTANTTLVVPGATTPAQTAEGSVVWDTDSDLLTVGTGAGRKTMVDTDSTQTLANKTLTSPTLTTPNIGAATGTSLSLSGNATLGDSTSLDAHVINGTVDVNVNTATTAFTITQTGSGNAFVVEDSTSPDSTPFVIDSAGNGISGATSITNLSAGGTSRFQAHGLLGYSGINNGADTLPTICEYSKNRGGAIVNSGDQIGQFRFSAFDGTNYIRAAAITAEVDGNPSTNSMPGRLVFVTTLDGQSAPTERYRINNAGNHFFGNTTANTNSTLMVVNGEISETTNNVQYKLVNQSDIGTAPNEIPLNQYLGELAFMNSDQIVVHPVASATPAGIGDMVFQLTNDTTLVIKVKGSDGVVRSNTLTLA